MWINDEVTYTPELIMVAHGEPIKAIVKAIGSDNTLTLLLPDGTEERVESRLCSVQSNPA